MEWLVPLLTLLVGLVAGSGGLFVYLNQRGQLDLDKTKHADSLAEGKRRYQLESLQKSVAALEGAINVMGSATWNGHVQNAAKALRTQMPAVIATKDQAAVDAYKAVMSELESAGNVRDPHMQRIILSVMTDAAVEVRRVIDET